MKQEQYEDGIVKVTLRWINQRDRKEALNRALDIIKNELLGTKDKK